MRRKIRHSSHLPDASLLRCRAERPGIWWAGGGLRDSVGHAARGGAALRKLDHLEPPLLAVPAEALQRLHSAAAQAMPTSLQRITPQSEPSAHQSVSEACIASRCRMPSPTSLAVSASTARPRTREAP
jgi:hypothetical protein